MKKYTLVGLVLILFITNSRGQYADKGAGVLRNHIWWLNWAGMTIRNGEERTVNTTNGTKITIRFSDVAGPAVHPNVMNTWHGAVFHNLYDFTDPAVLPALYTSQVTPSTPVSFKITVSVERNGVPIPFTLVAADAEASADIEHTRLVTNGGNWETIEFFRNSSTLLMNPLTGCGTKSVEITNTGYGSGVGQNPLLATRSSSGSIEVSANMRIDRDFGFLGLAFGIFSPVDRGDLPATFGTVQHGLDYEAVNSCNYLAPLPSLVQKETIWLGARPGDPDGLDNPDDNADGVDEDGVQNFPLYDGSGNYSVNVLTNNTTASNAYLRGWFDFNRNGAFETGERAAATIPPGGGAVTLSWTGIPPTIPLGSLPSFAFRFRISSDQTAASSPTGFTRDGEAEDYTLQQTIVLGNPSVDFDIPASVCVNEPVPITNKTTGGVSSYLWNFCSANISNVPGAQNLGNIGGFFQGPVFMDYAFDNGNYYAFITNNLPGGLVRLDFGNSLLNTPVATNLGNFGGVIPNGAEGIQLVKNEGKWYAIITGGSETQGLSRIIKISFGASLNNPSPMATNWGNDYGLSFPVDLHLFQDGSRWFGITVNSENNTLTRFDFTESFENKPTGVNIPLPAIFDFPTGIYTLYDKGNWYAFITNESPIQGNPKLIRLDFGNSLLNAPVAVDLGNPGSVLKRPRDITIFNYCGNITAFAVNATSHDIVRLDFGDNLLNTPSGTSLGNIGGLSFPHSISKVFRVGGDLYTFTTNVNNNTLTRFRFEGCSTIPVSTTATPPALTYTTPGTYNISLTVDEGLPTQASLCKQIVVMPVARPEFSFIQDVCDPSIIHFKNESTDYTSFTWDFGNGRTESNTDAPDVSYAAFGDYTVELKAELLNGCARSVIKQVPVALRRDSLIINRDTTLCFGTPFQLNALPALSYCWTPVAGLSDPTVANPVITTAVPKTTYYLTALMPTNSLVVNGNFSSGNTGFQSDYNYSPSNGVNEGVYTVSSQARTWHGSFGACGDHTSGNGNMLLVNGSSQPAARVWAQTITIQPNTNYAFSAWIQTMVEANPAQLQFSINGVQLGTTIQANSRSCVWNQFYAVWNSGNNTTANISIVNINLNTGGNDFALDDISFAPMAIVRDSVTVTIHENPDVDFSYTIPSCKSPLFTASANTEPSPIADWKWVFGDGTEGSSAAVAHSYVKGGEYGVKLVATDGNGCRDSIMHMVQLDTATAVVTEGELVCKGAEVSFSASGGVSYQWAPANLFTDASAAAQRVTLDTSTRFLVTVTDALSCTDTASVWMRVIPQPDFRRPPDREVCADSSVVMLGNNPDTYTYQWSPALAFDDATAMNPTARPPANTQYQVRITEGTCGYNTSFTVNVRVNPNPTVKAFSSNDVNCLNTSTFLSATTETGNRLEWGPAPLVDHSASAGRVVGAPRQTGYFTVKSTNMYGCAAYDSVLVNVTTDGPVGFQVPNAFTPNGDGINDCISLSRWGSVELHEFSIYSRWGEKVFSTNDPRRCWDGTYKGKPLSVGAYVYYIRAKGVCGEVTRKGHIMLVR